LAFISPSGSVLFCTTWKDLQRFAAEAKFEEAQSMIGMCKVLWRNDEGQDIAEYAVMLAVILVIVIGTIRLIGGNANNVFSAVASGIAQ
jgi:Flp pilus assembly pilin Flp